MKIPRIGQLGKGKRDDDRMVAPGLISTQVKRLYWMSAVGFQRVLMSSDGPDWGNLAGDERAKLVKQSGERTEYKVVHKNQVYFAKIILSSSLYEFTRWKTGGYPAQVEFDNLATAKRGKVPVPSALGWARGKVNGKGMCILVTEGIEDGVRLSDVAEHEVINPARRVEALMAAGEGLARLHHFGMYQENLGLGNFLLKGVGKDEVSSYFVDLQRVTFKTQHGMKHVGPNRGWRIDNLKEIVSEMLGAFSKDEIERFVQAYVGKLQETVQSTDKWSADEVGTYFNTIIDLAEKRVDDKAHEVDKSEAGVDSDKSLSGREFKNILIVKPSSLGDVIRCFPILHVLRKRYPEAKISWLIRNEFAPILEATNELDEILIFNRKRFSKIGLSWGVTKDFWAFIKALRGKKYDLVLDLQGLFRSGFMTWVTGAGVRMGFAQARELAWMFYNHKVTLPDTIEHVVESNWRFMERLGLDTEPMEFAIDVPAEAGERAKKKLIDAGVNPDEGFCVLLPGGSKAAKRWPADRMAGLAKRVQNDYNMDIVLIGAGGTEKDLAGAILGNFKELTSQDDVVSRRLVDLVNETDMLEMTAILQMAKLVVGNDSGPLHIGAALGVRTVSLYGPTDSRIVGPYGQMDGVIQAGEGDERNGRYSQEKEHQMEQITVDDVADMIGKRVKSEK